MLQLIPVSSRYINFRRQNSGARKKAIHDWHLVAFVFGLVLVDVTILTIHTTLEGVISHFRGGTDVNKEKAMAFEGVSWIVYFV